ncbi:MAG: SRPBCC family protein [Caulobacterales bacterium]|nr:SRPBCC family protein [Caulobacterales bacterium]
MSQTFQPPPGFVDTPHPPIGPVSGMATRVEEVVIERPLAQVLAAVDAMPLTELVQATAGLPGVIGEHDLTAGGYGQPGSRHLVFLSDGTTITEQIVDYERTAALYRFSYVVWNYSTPAARPIHYALAEFRYAADGPDRTRARWSYSFALRRNRFPGLLGGLGNRLLKAALLDGAYAKLMQGGLQRVKARAEAA